MTSESNSITISKDHYNYARWGLIALAILLLFALFKLVSRPNNVTITPPVYERVVEDGKDPQFSKATKAFLKQEGYDKIIFIGSRGVGGRVKLVDAEGKDISKCKLNNGKEFVDIPGRECEDIGKFKFTNLINIGVFYHNPGGNCVIIGGYAYCPRR